MAERLLNVFRGGGPLDDGLAYDTRYLLTWNPKVNAIAGYRWTPEIIVGQSSGRRCRVWQWKGLDELGS